jgi:hypothetical protein
MSERENTMKKNLGNTDRIARIALAVLLTVGAWLAGFGTIGGIVLLVLAVVMLVTSAISFCPLYLPFGFSTKGRPAAN